SLKDVRQMSPRDYRESWAWVHYFLNGPPEGKAELIAYLNDLRGGRVTVPLSERLEAADGETGPRLLAHLERVRENPMAAGPSRDATVRLQNNAAEPPAAPRKKSVLAR